MTPLIEIRPDPHGDGFLLRYGTLTLWYAEVIHAVNYAQDLCSHCDIAVYDGDGSVKHRYSAAGGGARRSDVQRAFAPRFPARQG